MQLLKVFLVIFVLSVFQIKSQVPEFVKYTTKNGLISDEVYNMHQDRLGYLWVFSNFGTVKYNGNAFKKVLSNLSFKESFIYTMYENEQGQKWIANSESEIFEVRNDSAFLIKGIEEITHALKKQAAEIFELYVDDNLTIYIFTKGYSYKLIKRNKGYYSVNLSTSFLTDSIMYRIEDVGKKSFTIANRRMIDGLDYINKVKAKSYLEIKKNKSSCIIRNPLYQLDVVNVHSPIRNLKRINNNYYFLYSNIFGVLDENNELLFVKLRSTALNFTHDDQGHFWICCLSDGIYELDSNYKILNHYLENTTVNDVLIDHQKGLWASTPGLGLYHCENLSGLTFDPASPLGTSISLVKTVNDVLYIANTKGEIVSITDSGFKVFPKGHNMEIWDIELHNDKLIVSTLLGTRDIHLQGDGIDSKFIRPSFYKTISVSKDTLIGTTRQTIVYVVNNKINKVLYSFNKINTFEVSNGVIWIATNSGVYCVPVRYKGAGELHNGVMVYDTIKLTRPEYLKMTANSRIIKIVKDKQTGLWFSSQGNGLFYCANSTVKNYKTENGLPEDIVNDFFISTDGSGLLSTNSGLYFSSIQDLKAGKAVWKRLYTGAVKMSYVYKGKVYMGTSNGLIVLASDKPQFQDNKVYFNLSSVKIDSKEVDPKLFHELQNYQKDLEFNFDFINFMPEQHQIKYNLIGRHTDERYVGNLNFRTGKLSPGNYSLIAYPDISLGKLSAITIPFYVEPAFWQMTVFWFFSVVAIIVIGSLIMLLILRYKRNEQATRVRNEQLLIEYKLVALKAQINPHFMSNCLSAIQDLVINSQIEKATFYIAEFGLLVRQILDFSSKQLITLEEELNLLTIYIKLEQLRFENKFDFEVQLSKDISLKDTFVPPLILNPIIENAIWHGLLPLQYQRKCKLIIIVSYDNSCLKISIEDNGIGRDASRGGVSNNNVKSYGITITQQRLTNLNYFYEVNSSKLIYSDIFNEWNEVIGTRAIILLPTNLKPIEEQYD